MPGIVEWSVPGTPDDGAGGDDGGGAGAELTSPWLIPGMTAWSIAGMAGAGGGDATGSGAGEAAGSAAGLAAALGLATLFGLAGCVAAGIGIFMPGMLDMSCAA